MRAFLMYFDEGTKCTRILKNDQTWTTDPRKPLAILEEECLKCGSTLEGRIRSYQALTGSRKRSAVMLSELTRQIYFPTGGALSRDSIWICYDAVLKLKGNGTDSCSIQFLDGSRYTVHLSKRSIKHQMERCALYLRKLKTLSEMRDEAVWDPMFLKKGLF